jgi:hypothetical protein
MFHSARLAAVSLFVLTLLVACGPTTPVASAPAATSSGLPSTAPSTSVVPTSPATTAPASGTASAGPSASAALSCVQEAKLRAAIATLKALDPATASAADLTTALQDVVQATLDVTVSSAGSIDTTLLKGLEVSARFAISAIEKATPSERASLVAGLLKQAALVEAALVCPVS